MWNTLKKIISNVGPKKNELHKSSFLPHDFVLTHLSECFGSPTQATKVAFDPVQKLCAIGCAGGIKVFGKVGVEATLKSDVASPLVQLFFIINEGGLVCVYENTIQIWNLTEKKITVTQQLQNNCSSASYSMGSKFVLLGDVKGCVTAFNLDSNYQLPNIVSYIDHIHGNVEVEPSAMPAVLAVDVNPLDNTQILIAFSNSVVVLFDVNARKAIKYFVAPAGIATLSYNRNGTKFVTGHNTGELAMWSTKDAASKVSFFVSESENNRRPIKRITWAKSKGENYLILVGGATAPGVPTLSAEGEKERVVQQKEGIIVVSGKNLRKNAEKKKLWFIEPMSGNVVDFALGFNSPWPSQLERDLQFMVSVTDTGKLMVHNLTKTGFAEISSPSTYLLLGDPYSKIVCSRVYKDCSASLFAVLRSTSQNKSSDDWPITGGSLVASIPGRELLVTGHSDGKIHFWHADVASLTHLYTLSVSPNLRQFEFSPVAARLLVAYDNIVQFYNLSVSARVVKTLVYDPTFSQQNAQTLSPPPEPTSTSTSQSSAASSPVQVPSTAPAHVSSPARGSPLTHSSGNSEQPTSSQPSSPLPHQQQQQQLSHSTEQLPQSPPHQQQQTETQQQKSETQHQKSETQHQKSETQQQKSETQQQTEQQQQQQQQQTQSPPLPSSPPLPTPTKTAAFFRPTQHFSSGFQLEGEFYMGSTVMSVHIAEDNRIVVGEENGYAACFTFDDESEVPFKVASHKKITEGTSITHVNSLGPTTDYPEISPQVVMGTQMGALGVFDSTSHQCTTTFRLNENSPVIFFQLVDRFGIPIAQRKDVISPEPLPIAEEPLSSSDPSLPSTPIKNLQISGEHLIPNPSSPSAPSSAPPSAPPSAPSSTPASPVHSPTPDNPAQQRISPDPSLSPTNPATSAPPSAPSSAPPSAPSSAPPSAPPSAPTSPTPISPIPIPQPPPGDVYAVVASEREINVFLRTLQESEDNKNKEVHVYERVAKAEVKSKLYNVAIFKYFGNNEACLAAFDVNGGIHMYTLLDLNRVHSITYQASVRFAPGPEGILYGLHPDGIFKASIFGAEFRPPPPELFVLGLAVPPPPKAGVFKSLFGKQSGGLDELLGQKEMQQKEASKPPIVQPQPTGGQGGQPRTIEEIKAKYGRPSTSATSDALSQAKQALNERGEKLSELSDKTADMEDASKEFLENIKKLKEKQSSWW